MRVQNCVRCGRLEECQMASEATYLPSYADGGPFCHGCLCWHLGVGEEDIEGGEPTPPPLPAWQEAWERRLRAFDPDRDG